MLPVVHASSRRTHTIPPTRNQSELDRTMHMWWRDAHIGKHMMLWQSDKYRTLSMTYSTHTTLYASINDSKTALKSGAHSHGHAVSVECRQCDSPFGHVSGLRTKPQKSMIHTSLCAFTHLEGVGDGCIPVGCGFQLYDSPHVHEREVHGGHGKTRSTDARAPGVRSIQSSFQIGQDG